MDFKYMEEHGMIDPSYAITMKELEEWFKQERTMFDSDEEYLAWYNEECRKIAKENDLELEPRIYKLK